jgi:surface polysaccharide O-acyltransferase-like enzyme
MSYFLILLSIIIFDFIGIKIYLFSKHSTYLTGMNMLPLLFCSITFLLWFKNININYNRYINIISSSMFGVYLIHDNNIVRYLLWKDIFKNNSYFESKYLFLHSISSVLLVFLCCILIDQFKKLILEKPLSRKIEVFSIYFLGKLQNFNIKLYNLVNRTFGCNH